MTSTNVLTTWNVAYPRRSGPWTLAGAEGQWGLLDPETGAVSVADPTTDSALPALPAALRRGTLLGYRAGRRAVVSTGHTYVKVVRPHRLARLVDTHEALDAECSGVEVPSVEGVDCAGSVDLTPVRGMSLHESLRSRSAETVLQHIAAVGGALARFHTSSIADVDGGQLAAQDWVATVGRVEPEAVGELAQLASHLPVIPQTRPTRIHGDLHDKNIFIDTDAVSLIDLDGCGTGYPEDDVANLAVHLQLRVLQFGLDSTIGLRFAARLYEAYACEAPLATARVEAVERHTWFRLGCLYRYRAASRHLVPEMLRRASVPMPVPGF